MKMKPVSLFAIVAFAFGVHCAAAMPSHNYANSISVRNITTMQQSIMLSAIRTYEGSAAIALGSRADILARTGEAAHKNSPSLYDEQPLYGKMPTYGEYGDDTGILGHSGGDATERPALNSMWLNWQHYDDDASIKHYGSIDSDYDVILFGLGGGHSKMGVGISQWGVFGGYAGSEQKKHDFSIDERGGYIGIYSGYSVREFNISVALDGGAMYNDADTAYGTDEYANMWLGSGINASYNIALTDSFSLQPAIYLGYTWVRSANYTAESGEDISNENFRMLDITPALRAIKHLGRGWFGILGVKYTFTSDFGGDVSVNDVDLPDLESRDFIEYGLGVEKSIDRFNIYLNINHRDGGRKGWNGGIGFKYFF